MIVLVCGSREWKDYAAIRRRLAWLPPGTTILHGGARGADQLAAMAARSLGLFVREMPADWKGLGRSAGIRRNLAMLDERPALVLAFWLNASSGTHHTINAARARGIPTEVIAA